VITAGFSTVQIKSNAKGLIDIEELKRAMSEDVAALMITNPNTLGLFETDILEIARVVHDAGAILYMDGANLNALMGLVRPGDMGFDVVHFNLHKTFSTPHGGGGPGSGPVGVKENLAPFLPVPVVAKKAGNKGVEEYYLDYKRPHSIGRVHSFYGNFGVMVRAYVYIRQNGAKGLREVSENAIINANYLREILKQYYHLPYDYFCQHEFVLSGDRQKEKGVKTLDIAKRLLDFGLHAPTVYFPLIVHEALMIEPTETESKESLDEFADAMIQIAKEVNENPEVVTSAPHVTPVGRLDEVKAAKDLDLKWKG
jgi:glycine dehydrogenase subunit 2